MVLLDSLDSKEMLDYLDNLVFPDKTVFLVCLDQKVTLDSPDNLVPLDYLAKKAHLAFLAFVATKENLVYLESLVIED